jgi:hypothetical protein
MRGKEGIWRICPGRSENCGEMINGKKKREESLQGKE